MTQTSDIGMFTAPRTLLITLAVVMLAPFAVLAASVGSNSSVNAGTHTGATVGGGNPTLIGTETNTTTTSHVKALKSNDTSAVGTDSSLSTTPAPLGGNSKAGIGLGVEARVPGATGR